MAFKFPNHKLITPVEFEQTVLAWFESFDYELLDFEATHLEKHKGVDGDYEIDVTARFRILDGVDFTLLCECKRYSNPIERELLQILNDKKRSTCASKAMMVATHVYRSGAQTFAEANQIALVEVTNGEYAYLTNSVPSVELSVPDDADPYCGVIDVELSDGITFGMPVTTKDYKEAIPAVRIKRNGAFFWLDRLQDQCILRDCDGW